MEEARTASQAGRLHPGGRGHRSGGVSFNYVSSTEVELALKSEPASIIDEASNLENGTEATLIAEDSYGTLRFTVWKLNGVEQRDANGQALNPHTFIIDGNSTATAVLVEQDADTDGDGLTDWYELRHLGNFENQLTDDADGDGWHLYEEWYRNTDPHAADETVTYRVRESSNPEGVFADIEEYFGAGGSYTTTACCENASGRFAYTTINGVRQQDALGRAGSGDPRIWGRAILRSGRPLH